MLLIVEELSRDQLVLLARAYDEAFKTFQGALNRAADLIEVSPGQAIVTILNAAPLVNADMEQRFSEIMALGGSEDAPSPGA